MSEWQPIDTAPWNGVEFLVNQEGSMYVARRLFDEPAKQDDIYGCKNASDLAYWNNTCISGDFYVRGATHWMHLPNPPTK
jgi:hypothetical protein